MKASAQPSREPTYRRKRQTPIFRRVVFVLKTLLNRLQLVNFVSLKVNALSLSSVCIPHVSDHFIGLAQTARSRNRVTLHSNLFQHQLTAP